MCFSVQVPLFLFGLLFFSYKSQHLKRYGLTAIGRGLFFLLSISWILSFCIRILSSIKLHRKNVFKHIIAGANTLLLWHSICTMPAVWAVQELHFFWMILIVAAFSLFSDSSHCIVRYSIYAYMSLVGFLWAAREQQHSFVSQALEGKMLQLVFLSAAHYDKVCYDHRIIE